MESEFQQAWLWLGKESAEFGFRWVVVGLIVLGFGGWFGKRYHAMRRDVAELKRQANQPAQPTVNVNVGEVVRQQVGPNHNFGIAAHEDDDTGIVHFGTTVAPLSVRMREKEQAVADIIRWLHRNGMLATLKGGGNKPPRIEGEVDGSS